MDKIKIGFTNESFRDNNLFIQNKKYNKFNHKIDYSLLEKFDFVPKLVENNKNNLKFQWIENVEFEWNSELLEQMAEKIKILHDSKLPFPKTNIASRIKEYRKLVKQKGLKIEVLNKYFKRINNILSYSENNRPLHNDLFKQNILLDKNNKLWIIDWEYSTMGDKHFDLAYFILSNHLNNEQEQIFLDKYDTYWDEYLWQQKILVLYLVILWVNAQEVKHFDDRPYINELERTVKIYQHKKENNLFRK